MNRHAKDRHAKRGTYLPTTKTTQRIMIQDVEVNSIPTPVMGAFLLKKPWLAVGES